MKAIVLILIHRRLVLQVQIEAHVLHRGEIVEIVNGGVMIEKGKERVIREVIKIGAADKILGDDIELQLAILALGVIGKNLVDFFS